MSCYLVKQNVVYCWFRNCFILAPCLNLTMTMESVFSFLPSYFSIILLAKAKISKSVIYLVSQSYRAKMVLAIIRLQDFKSNISLEQSNKIVYFFTCWYQKLRVDRKFLGWCGHPGHKMNRWMNGSIELIFHVDANIRKLRIIYIL